MNLSKWLILCVWQALVREIYSEIRAIALRYDVDKNLLNRYYFDREPTDDDLECIECVITSIWVNTSSRDQIRNIEVDAIYTEKKWPPWMHRRLGVCEARILFGDSLMLRKACKPAFRI